MNGTIHACRRLSQLDQIESEMIRLRAILCKRLADLDTITKEVAFASTDEIIPLCEMEKNAILLAVRKVGPIDAAKLLGISKATLYRKLVDYGVDIHGVKAQKKDK